MNAHGSHHHGNLTSTLTGGGPRLLLQQNARTAVAAAAAGVHTPDAAAAEQQAMRALEQGLRHLQDLEWSLPTAATGMLTASAFKAALDIAEEHRTHRARNAAGFGAQHVGGDMFRVVLASMRQYLELHSYVIRNLSSSRGGGGEGFYSSSQLAANSGGSSSELQPLSSDGSITLVMRDFERLAPMLAQWGILVNEPSVTFASLDSACTGFVSFDTLCRWAQRMQLDVLSASGKRGGEEGGRGGHGGGRVGGASAVGVGAARGGRVLNDDGSGARWPSAPSIGSSYGSPSPRDAAASLSARAATLRAAAARGPPGAPLDDPIAGASADHAAQLVGAGHMQGGGMSGGSLGEVRRGRGHDHCAPYRMSSSPSDGALFFTEDAPRLSVASHVGGEVHRAQAELARMKEHCVLLSRHNKRLTLEIGRLVSVLESRGGADASLARSPYRAIDLRGNIPAPAGFGTDKIRLKAPVEPHRRAPPPPLSSRAANSLSTQNLHVVARELWERENPIMSGGGSSYGPDAGGVAAGGLASAQLAEADASEAVDRAIDDERYEGAEHRMKGAAERETAAVEREREAFTLEREKLLIENERMTSELERAANEVSQHALHLSSKPDQLMTTMMKPAEWRSFACHDPALPPDPLPSHRFASCRHMSPSGLLLAATSLSSSRSSPRKRRRWRQQRRR